MDVCVYVNLDGFVFVYVCGGVIACVEGWGVRGGVCE